MLTKKQTLWSVPILVASFGMLCLLGYVAEEIALGKNTALSIIIGTALMGNIFVLIFVLFSIFASFGTALIFNASSPEFWEKTGNPLHFLLWKELREATTRKKGD